MYLNGTTVLRTFEIRDSRVFMGRVVPAEVRFAIRREQIIFCVPDNPDYPKFSVNAFLKTSFSAVPTEAEAVVNYGDVTGCVVHLTIPEFSSNGVLGFELIIENSRGDKATVYYSGTEITKYLEFAGESEARLPLITTITAVTRKSSYNPNCFNLEP
ncbi:unnamed protein product [Linum tenue]|uniref:Uncharacterized protein n=2 Tax=Linum tenue TaxID=586396 RepID=A0AAV0RRU6_9ROSI|nr:unnamed protein product [Linum tenue]